MTNKKVIYLVIVILFMVGIGFTTFTLLGPKSGKAGKLLSEQVRENTSEIGKVLPSPDNKYTAFIIGDEEQSLYVGQDKNLGKAKKVHTGLKDYTNLSWAPDSQYLFVGSTDSSGGVILKPQDLVTRFSIGGYVSGPFWEPEGDKVCFTVKNSIRKKSGLSEETTDILVINLKEELGGVRFARGTLDYYYKVDSWEKDGKIKYSKVSSRGDKLIEQLCSEFAHYLYSIDIDSQEQEKLAAIKDLEYLHFSPSPDREWLSMVKLTARGGEAEEGTPFFYNVESGKMINLKEEYNIWAWDAKWFKDSSKIMFDERTVYDVKTGDIITYEMPEDIVLLGGEPSPDGSKIAVFACQYVSETGSQGEPLILYLLDSDKKKIVKKMETSLFPFFENNHQSPIPIRFTWVDNQNLIVESWLQEENSISSLWKLNITDGSIKKFSDLGQNPLASPNGQKVVYWTEEHSADSNNRNPHTLLKICSQDGTLLGSLDMEENGFHSFAGKILWDNSSNFIMATFFKYEEEMLNKYLLYWDLKVNKVKKLLIEKSFDPLYIENGKIVCVDGFGIRG
jgi:WD40 repeat protein